MQEASGTLTTPPCVPQGGLSAARRWNAVSQVFLPILTVAGHSWGWGTVSAQPAFTGTRYCVAWELPLTRKGWIFWPLVLRAVSSVYLAGKCGTTWDWGLSSPVRVPQSHTGQKRSGFSFLCLLPDPVCPSTPAFCKAPGCGPVTLGNGLGVSPCHQLCLLWETGMILLKGQIS